jgi:hypothetical protein
MGWTDIALIVAHLGALGGAFFSGYCLAKRQQAQQRLREIDAEIKALDDPETFVVPGIGVVRRLHFREDR